MEKNKVIEQFKKLEPSANWRDKTLSKLVELESFSTKKNSLPFLNLFFNYINMKKKMLFFSTLFLVLGIFGTSIIITAIFPNKSRVQPVALTLENKDLILRNFLNTAQAFNSTQNSNKLSSNTNATDQQAMFAAESDSDTRKMALPSFDILVYEPNTLIYSKAKMVEGPAKCEQGYFLGALNSEPEVTIENYSFNSSDAYSSISINQAKNVEGDLVDFSIYKNTDSYYESIVYKGGKYGVKSRSDYASPMPVTAPATMLKEDSQITVEEDEAEAKIEEVFGPDVTYYIKKDKNENDAFVIESSYFIFCNQEQPMVVTPNPNFWAGEDWDSAVQSNISLEEGDTKIISLIYLNTNDYQGYYFETYANSISPENLIVSTEYLTIEKTKTTFEDAEQKLSALLPVVNLKTEEQKTDISEVDYEAEKLQQLQYLQDNNIQAIVSNNTRKSNNFFSINNYSSLISSTYTYMYYPEYLSDRDFYRPGINGDKEFERYTKLKAVPYPYYSWENVPLSLLSYGTSIELSNGVSNLNIETFENKFSDIEILNTRIHSPVKEKSEENIELEIGGKLYGAKLYNYTITSGGESYSPSSQGAEEGSADASFEMIINEPLDEKHYYIILEEGNFKYLIFENIWYSGFYKYESGNKEYFAVDSVLDASYEYSAERINEFDLKFLNPANEGDLKEIERELGVDNNVVEPQPMPLTETR